MLIFRLASDSKVFPTQALWKKAPSLHPLFRSSFLPVFLSIRLQEEVNSPPCRTRSQVPPDPSPSVVCGETFFPLRALVRLL